MGGEGGAGQHNLSYSAGEGGHAEAAFGGEAAALVGWEKVEEPASKVVRTLERARARRQLRPKLKPQQPLRARPPWSTNHIIPPNYNVTQLLT